MAISSNIHDVNVPVDCPVTLSIGATGGSGNYSYQWQIQYDDNDWANITHESYNGAQTDTLSFEAKTNRNGYQYRCIVTDSNADTVISNEILLSLVLAIEIQPENIITYVDCPVELTIMASSPNGKPNYQWQIKFDNNDWANITHESYSGIQTETLRFTAQPNRNGYKYRCIVSDNDGNSITSKEITLKIIK